MKELLLDIISKYSIISYKKLLELYSDSEVNLATELKKLLNDNVISKKVVLLCPECSVSLGFKESYQNKDTINCENCDYEIDLIEENFEVFFFSICISI